MPENTREPTYVASAARLVDDLTDRTEPARCRPLPIVTVHAPPGGGAPEVLARLRDDAAPYPHAVLTATDPDLPTVRDVLMELYDKLTWERAGYGVLPLPRFGLVILGIDVMRDLPKHERRPEIVERLIRAKLAAPGELRNALIRLGLATLGQSALVPGITDAAVDPVALLIGRGLEEARWRLILKRSVGIADHRGAAATAPAHVMRVVTRLGCAALDSEPLDDAGRYRADLALCRVFLTDLRDAFTVRRGSVRVQRACRVLVDAYAEGTAVWRFCEILAEVRREWAHENVRDFDPLAVVAFDDRWPVAGSTPVAESGYERWLGKAAAHLYREDAWWYPVEVDHLTDLDVLAMLDAADRRRPARTADRILALAGGHPWGCGKFVEILRDRPELDVHRDADLPAFLDARVEPEGRSFREAIRDLFGDEGAHPLTDLDPDGGTP